MVNADAPEGPQKRQVDLSANHLLELHYIEDITKANTVTAITINDTESAIVSDLYGLEPVEITWTDNALKPEGGNTFTQQLVIYDIKDRQIISGKKLKATLYCISKDAINNSSQKISRRFGKGGGESISEMVSSLMKTDIGTLKSVSVDPTLTKLSFVSPYWDPYTIIKWLGWRAIFENSGTGSAGFLFWENPDGYQFRAMDNVVRRQTTRTVRVNYVEDENAVEEDNRFIDIGTFSVSGTSDVFRGLNLGSYASTTFTLDMKDFTYKEVPFNINTYYPAMKKLNPASELPAFYEIFDADVEAKRPTRIMSKVLDTAMYTEGTYTQDLTKQLSQSMIRNQFFFNQSAVFEYEGDQTLRTGEVVEVNTWRGKQLEPDTKQSGRYIVGKIYRQYLTERDMMSTRVTLYRDSLG